MVATRRLQWGGRQFRLLMAAILLAETALCGLIVAKVAYTEIDWTAYMEEVSGFLAGERNYLHLRGGTGPLVYPAGFVYVYSFFYTATNAGEDILLAQCWFIAVYVATLAAVMLVYRRAGTVAPPWALLLLCLSKRMHSIFVLRLFNDCIAMLLLYASILIFTYRRWSIGCLVFSLAVSVKTNVLLFAPGLLMLLLQSGGIRGSVPNLAICAGVQLLLGAPFLREFPWEYISKSVELDRVFFHKWTVNYKFLSVSFFEDPKCPLGAALLAGTLVTLYAFARYRWGVCSSGGGGLVRGGAKLSPEHIVTVMLSSNFIGVVFFRTLHYQFYCWYFHALPYLVWRGALPAPLGLLCVAAIEWCFSYVYPATPLSSAVLQLAHFSLLGGLWWSRPSPSSCTKKES